MLELRAATDLARLWRDMGSLNDPPPAAGSDSRRDRGRREIEGRPLCNARAMLAEIE
jgi:hypothetical protein